MSTAALEQGSVTRIDIVAEATALEKAGGDWSLRHTCAMLGCSRASLYRNPWLMSKRIQQPGGFVWHPRDVRLYQALQTGTKQRRKGA